MSTYLGIDIGGSSFKYGWGNTKTGLQHFGSISLAKKELGAFMDTAKKVLKEVQAKIGLKHISAVGIGTPGTIDWSTGKLVGVNPNLPFWIQHDPRELIPSELPVFYDNDANLMALAEARQLNLQNIMGITVGSGIGCGLIIEGKIFHGSHGFAGELGHVCVVDDGAVCNCGKTGCMEAYASVDGLRNRLATESPRYGLMELTQLLSIREIDPLVESYINEGRIMLSRAIANAITWIDPQSVVLGGGAMDVGLYSLSNLHAEIEQRLPVANCGRVEIIKATHGNKAGVIGAIILAEESFNAVSE